MQNTYTAIIIDDEKDALEGLKTLLIQSHPDIKVLAKCENAVQGIREIAGHKPDLVFLDIEMPGKDGFFVAKELKSLEIDSTIIFVTAYDQYAIKAIKHAAFDFITKPIDPDELALAVTRFKSRNEKEIIKEKLECLSNYLDKQHIRFSTNRGFTLINPESIVYCQAEGNYTELIINDDERIVVTQQIGQIEKQLKQNFIRISRSYLLNVYYLKEYNSKKKTVSLSIENLPELPVSRGGYKRLQAL
jgi:two-component system LytT family response regulator